jgi:hypothetical protein
LRTTADSLAYAFAIALRDESLRGALRDALRDSPFRGQRIHLKSYLHGSAGRPLALAAASAVDKGPAEFYAWIAGLPELEISIPNAFDRLRWTGSDSMAVVATLLTGKERYEAGRVTEPGISLSGFAVSIGIFVGNSQPYISINPSERSFGPDPEGARLRAPVRTGRTVSTHALERYALVREGEKGPRVRQQIICDWRGEFCYDDDPPPEIEQGGVALPESMTADNCFGVTEPLNSTTDADNDQVLDSCEQPIAEALRPLLNISVSDPAATRESYWTLARHPQRSNSVQILYAIAYWEDAGDPSFSGFAHHGDSEFIILEARNVHASRWAVDYATLSAHWGTGVYDATATYHYSMVEMPLVYRAKPRIWAAQWKHANYRSADVCDAGPGGILSSDSCNGSYFGSLVDVLPSRNLGNFNNLPPNASWSSVLLNCVGSSLGRPGTECFWDPNAEFYGWVAPRSGAASTSYAQMLYVFQF